MPKKKCKKCDRRVQARGLCSTHYNQWWRKHMYEYQPAWLKGKKVWGKK